MDIDTGRGRGRGRGSKNVSEQERTDLRRPLILQPEITNASVPILHETFSASNISVINPWQVVGNSMQYQDQRIPQNLIQNQGTIMFPSPLPEQLTNDLSTMSLANSSNITHMGMASSLSADAPEFVPRFEPFQHVSSPLVQTNMGSNVGICNQQVIHQPAGPQLQYLSHPVILQVNNIVVNLTIKPHKFDQIATQMTSILSWQVKEANLMKEIVSVIFEQGVGEANFRYNGARLCQHLAKHVTQSYNGPTFKTFLLQKCQEEYECREYYLQQEPNRLCGFALFLADIYNHVVTPTAQPLDILRSGICRILLTLMANPTTNNLKCVAQVMKGSGHALEAGGRDDMEAIMCQLKDVAMTAKVPVNVRSLLLSVVELRAANWGRSHEASENPPHYPESDVPHLGTVYYGPGGVIQRVDDENEDSASDTDDSCYAAPPQTEELEGEVAKAFEEFLRSQQQ